MNLRQGIKLKFFSIAFPVAIVTFLSVIGAALWLVASSFKQVEQVLDRRQQTLALTSELSRVTELQARLVRAYAATGDTRFLTYYYGLAEYRNGKTASPTGDPAQYWEEVIAGLREYVPAAEISGRSFPLRMREAGFSTEELAVLDRALAIGDQLQKTEQIAFAATQGLYDPDKGEFVSDGKPNIDFALRLVYGPEYARLQASLTSEVSRLAKLADARTSLSVQASTSRLLNAIVAAGTAMGMLLALALLASFFIERYVLSPMQKFAAVADRIATGDYQTRLVPSKAVAELGTLASAFNNMATAIEEDIKQRQAVMRELEEARAVAESATRAKSMFLANMSHEVRTPMNAIIGMAYLTLKTRLDARQRDYVSKIHDAGKALLGVINGILDFSKIEANRLELERVPFDLQQSVANSVFLVRESAIEKEIELLLDMDPALIHEPRLLGDGLRLGEVLTNLLSNAVKFTHRGYVQLTVRLVRVDDATRELRFTVADTGIGMTPEQKSRLFEEFIQADGSTTRKYGGTGLGLAISKRLVKLMGGTIEVESEPDRGSRFHFTAQFGKTDARVPVLPAGAAGGRVLVVDDLPEARLVLVHMLEDLGLEVMQAKDGAEALEALHEGIQRQQPFAMAFIDWVMPGMNGGALINAIRARFGKHAPQLLVVSAYDTEGLREAVDSLGVKHFLPKPVLPALLQQLFAGLRGEQVAAGGAVAIPRPPSLEGMRVLLVEDHPVNQQLALELLRDIGISPDLAHHGQEAINRLAEHDQDYYSLVLMDLQMPVLDGYETAKRLRADARYVDLPIVAMTAHVTLEERERCLALGMRGHIAKPIDPDELFRLIASLGRRAAGAKPVAVQFAGAARQPTTLPHQDGDVPAGLPCIDGLDTQAGLNHTRGKQILYLNLLKQFVAGFRSFGQQTMEFLRDGKRDDAQRLAHSLKAVADSLGARRVAEAASKLELLLRRGEPSAAALTSVELELGPLMSALAVHFRSSLTGVELPSLVERPGPHLSSVPLPGWVDDLRQLLADGDVAARQLWEQRGEELSGLLPIDTYGRLRRALDNFEFDAALEALPAPKARV